ncbi:nitroreductase family protein [uncultured Helcococcus sp.]|uniref:nitroreductase family protein n=1 Tax=uncultured Helcococcus sp. TaxID=1072508 RepID=UPI00288BAC98|nr:nitroreductase family protein [uncultured Helcococcus sp.]
MKKNETISRMLEHRSIRQWKSEPLSDEIIETLKEVAIRTSTSEGMQYASIIRVKDPAKRKELVEVSTQKYLATAPELWIFIADNYRNDRIYRENKDENNFVNDADKFFQAFTDAAIMAQNVMNAAESMGLGAVYFGSILNDPKKTIEILELPENTFPVVGMGIDYPDQKPQLKPRMKADFRIFEDRYEKIDNYHELLKNYDKEMSKYYDLRIKEKPLDEFTKQVEDKYKVQRTDRSKILRVIRDQGYNLDI